MDVCRMACDGDVCYYLGAIPYSTNPREFVTVGDMEDAYVYSE